MSYDTPEPFFPSFSGIQTWSVRRLTELTWERFTTVTLRTIRALAIALGLSTCALLAQSNGSMTGVVKDSTGGVVVGASVSVADASHGVNQTVTTNASGEFAFPLLPPGNYTLTIALTGFKRIEKA